MQYNPMIKIEIYFMQKCKCMNLKFKDLISSSHLKSLTGTTLAPADSSHLM
jgi:hypothetical protein